MGGVFLAKIVKRTPQVMIKKITKLEVFLMIDSDLLNPEKIIGVLEKELKAHQDMSLQEILVNSFEQKNYIPDEISATKALKRFSFPLKDSFDNSYSYCFGELGAMEYVLIKGVTKVETDPVKLANSVAYSIAAEALSKVKGMQLQDEVTTVNVQKIIDGLNKQAIWHRKHRHFPTEKAPHNLYDLTDPKLADLLIKELKWKLIQISIDRDSQKVTLSDAWQQGLSKYEVAYGSRVGKGCLENFKHGDYYGTLGAVAYLAKRKKVSATTILDSYCKGLDGRVSAANLANKVGQERTLELLGNGLKKAGLNPNDLLTSANIKKIANTLPKTIQPKPNVLKLVNKNQRSR